MKTCPHCQSANLDSTTTCTVCGNSIVGATAPPPAAPPPGPGQPVPPPGPGQPSSLGTGAPPSPGGMTPPPPGGMTPPPGMQPPGMPPQTQMPPNAGGPQLYQPGMPISRPAAATNQLAVWSLITSVASVALTFMCGIGVILAPVGAILGHVALSQIKRNGGEGKGLAIAGIVVGWLVTLLVIVGIVGLFALGVASGSS